MAKVITLSSDTESATDSATDVEIDDRWAPPAQVCSSPPPSLSPPPTARPPSTRAQLVETIEISDDDEDEDEESSRGRGGSQPPSWSYGGGPTGPASSSLRVVPAQRPPAPVTVDFDDDDDVVDLSAAPSAELLPATNSWDSVAWGRAAAGAGATAARAAEPPPAPLVASSLFPLEASSDGLGPDNDDDDDFWYGTGGSMPLPRLHSSAAPSSDLGSDLDGTSASLPASQDSVPTGRRRGAGKASRTTAASRKRTPAIQAEAKARRAAQQAEKAATAEARQREREARKTAEERDKHNRRVMASIEKRKTGSECLQELEVTVDTPMVTNPGGAELLAALQLSNIKLKLAEQPYPNTITVHRHCTTAAPDAATGRLETHTEVKREPWVLLRWTLEQLSAFVLGLNDQLPQRLATVVPTVRRFFGPDVQIFLVLEGLPAMARGPHAPVPPPATGKTLPRARIDAELVFLELAGGCFVTETDRPASTNGAIVKILEAIAEQPYQKLTQFDFFAEAYSSAATSQLAWVRILETVPSVTNKVARGIVSEYPTVRSLLNAYETARSTEDAQLLLQDIAIDRGHSARSTSRRIGPVLSRRIHLALTATDPATLVLGDPVEPA